MPVRPRRRVLGVCNSMIRTRVRNSLAPMGVKGVFPWLPTPPSISHRTSVDATCRGGGLVAMSARFDRLARSERGLYCLIADTGNGGIGEPRHHPPDLLR